MAPALPDSAAQTVSVLCSPPPFETCGEGRNCHGGAQLISVLGVDAAWTDRRPSGVALIRAGLDGLWDCAALAPSYDSFVELAAGNPVRWQEPTTTPGPGPRELLAAAQRLLGGERVTVVSVDMPLSRLDITGRREADNAISRTFGARGCGTHSPSRDRPGKVSTDFHQSLSRLGYGLAVDGPWADSLIEVYPAPALLCLLGYSYRIPYKVSRTLRYWPDLGRQERAERIIRNFNGIHEGLSKVICGIPPFVPRLPYSGTLSSLKRYEDALDSLVCAWVGARYLEGRAEAFGDDDAAIWVPTGAGSRASSRPLKTVI